MLFSPRTSECPLCKKKLLVRHFGPLHLRAEDLALAPNDANNVNAQNIPENVEEQVESINDIESNSQDGANVQNDSENNMDLDNQNNMNTENRPEENINEHNTELIGSSELDGQNDALQSVPQIGSNYRENESAAIAHFSVDDAKDGNVASGNVPFNRCNS